MREFKPHVPVQDINEVTKSNHYIVSLEVKYRYNNWETKIDNAVLPKIQGMLPATFVDCNDWGIPESVMLVEEKFNNRNSIAILSGADVFFEVLHHDKKMQPGNYPVLQDSDLG
jgi:hypothetical protein